MKSLYVGVNLKDMWIGVPHNGYGEAGNKCSHREMDDSDKTPLKNHQKTMDYLRDVVLDKVYLQFYTRFR